MKDMRRIIRGLLRRAVGDSMAHKLYPQRELVRNPFRDMKFLLDGLKCPTVFDVGANVGQSVDNFKRTLPDSVIHSFEPSPTTYAKLSKRCDGLDGVKTWNCGVGSRQATLQFLENSEATMSSFLAPDEASWGRVEKATDVNVLTLDSFANEQNIDFVHILKSDTQGYDFEVFKGAEGLMRENRIGLVFFEFIFSNMYKGLPAFHEVFEFLSERDFALVSFYEPHFQKDILGWADFLFINADFNRRRLERGSAAKSAGRSG